MYRGPSENNKFITSFIQSECLELLRFHAVPKCANSFTSAYTDVPHAVFTEINLYSTEPINHRTEVVAPDRIGYRLYRKSRESSPSISFTPFS
jgi:hypothetical protein